MKRLFLFLSVNLITILVFAQVALADSANDHGEGWWGETDDLTISKAGFILIAGFPLFVLLASLLQWKLEKRKTTRKAAEKARLSRADKRGGW